MKKGLNHIVTLLESQDRRPSLVVIAHDVEPAETIVWLPELCRRQDVPYCIVKSKVRRDSRPRARWQLLHAPSAASHSHWASASLRCIASHVAASGAGGAECQLRRGVLAWARDVHRHVHFPGRVSWYFACFFV